MLPLRPPFRGRNPVPGDGTPGTVHPLFDLETTALARRLLSYGLYVVNPDGSRCGGVIVETEAYLADDEASHSYRGRTARNASMFLPAGHVYVYRSYGIHWCVNVVTAAEGIGEAVLLRALEPRRNVEKMHQRRGIPVPPPGGRLDRRLTNGPGKLCQALGICAAFDGCPLEVWDEDSEQVLAEQMNSISVAMDPQLALIREDTDTEQEIIVGPRVGITRAVERPLRFRRSGNRWTGR